MKRAAIVILGAVAVLGMCAWSFGQTNTNKPATQNTQTGQAAQPAGQAAAAPLAQHLRRRAKACILLFQIGGPYQCDTFDPKPDASEEIRGPFRRIATRVPGVFVTEGPQDSGLIDIRDAETGKSVLLFQGHDGDVNDVAFSPGDHEGVADVERLTKLYRRAYGDQLGS